jgi:imidazolonepropionase-like amidohydrolase
MEIGMSKIPGKQEIGMSDPVDVSAKQLNRREMAKIAVAGALGAALNWSQCGFATAQTGPKAESKYLVLEGGTLIDGTGRDPILNAVIVVEGTRIKAVGQRGKVSYPRNTTVMKFDGLTILPGLIDSHVHSQEWHTPMFLHYGVTTVVDKNLDATWILAQREALRSGAIYGPRFFVSGSVMHGVYGFKLPWDTWNYPPVTTVEEARAYAQSMVALGVDMIAVNQNITDDQLRAAIDVANQAGLPIFGHTRNIRRAAELGFEFAEHFFTVADALLDPDAKDPPEAGGPLAGPGYVPPEGRVDPKQFPPLIDYMVKQGVYFNPTLVNEWRAATPRGQQYAHDAVEMIRDPGLAFVPDDVKHGWTQVPKRQPVGYNNVKEFLRQYAEAGGRIIVGTDAHLSSIPGLSVHQEMQMLVDAGVPPMKVIEGATLWNAELLKKDKDLGSVEPGKAADFLVIEGNPLADITATQNVRTVIKDGAVMSIQYDPKWVNPIPQPYSVFEERPAPGITKVSPAIVRQGGQTVTLQIQGRKFTPNAVVRFDDTDLPTRFVSATELTATVDAGLLKGAPGSYALYVLNPGLHGTVSETGYLVIDTESNPVNSISVPYSVYAKDPPQIFGPTPRSARADGKVVELQLEGTKFAPNAVIHFDDASLPTRFVSSTKLAATLDSRLLKRHPGGYVVYVVNPGLNGNVSAPSYFLVDLKEQ